MTSVTRLMIFSKAPTVVAALLASTVIPLLGSEVIPWKPGGISSPQFESHAAFDPEDGRPLLRAQLARVRRLADSRQPLHREGMVQARATRLCGRRGRGRPVFHARRPKPLFHLLALAERDQAERP